jgi:tetratricopeptide (TPR) repeat protein
VLLDMPDQNPPQDLQSLLDQGIAASNAREPDAALAIFVRCIQAYPHAPEPHLLIAAQHAAHRRFEQAENAFASAILLAPDLHVARYQLGLLQLTCGRATMALLTWQPLLLLPEDNPLAHFVRGYAALANDDFGIAEKHFDSGLDCENGNAPLAEDIQKVLLKVREIIHQTAEKDSPPAEEASRQQHVLLSNYQR